jgi:extracellular factor (EF) 3-hydroxypalmitic acid methyl ester biosynthesis protein
MKSLKSNGQAHLLNEHRSFVQRLASQGGPKPQDYEGFTRWLNNLAAIKATDSLSQTELHSLWAELGDAMTPETMQGFSFTKPHGYSGDYEIIERIYQSRISPKPELANWDIYFHAQAAPNAVRNRKRFFKNWLHSLEMLHPGRNVRVLNLGSGSARDMSEYFTENPDSGFVIDCVDHDKNANAFAAKLCAPFPDKINFFCANALRFHPANPPKIIWSAGLFDYLNDNLFVLLLRRLWRTLESGGELVLGNFCPANPTRAYMELVGEWILNHRSEEDLLRLATVAGLPAKSVSIESEPEGVNLFLRAQKE